MNPDSAVAARTIVRPAIGTVVAGVIGTVWGAIVAGGPGVVAGIMATVVVLVSCDAAACARDARLLADQGYTLESVTLVDLFPHTPHVEVVSRLVAWQR